MVDGTDSNLQPSRHLGDGQFAWGCVGVGRWDAVDVTSPAYCCYIEGLAATRAQAGRGELGRDLLVAVPDQSLDQLEDLARSGAAVGRGSSCHDLVSGP